MGKANSCLKLAFVLLNVIFVVIGLVMIHVSVMSSYNYKVSGFHDLNPLKVWVFALIILFIAILGIYGAIAENNIVLKIFAGLTIIMMIIYLIMGILLTVYRKAISDNFNKFDGEMIKVLMNETEIEEIQRTVKCCGVLHAEDWGEKIPESCKCTASGPDARSKCKPRPQGTKGPDLIYSQSCRDFYYAVFSAGPTVAMALFYGFFCIEILILTLDFLMSHQIKRSNSG